MKRKITAGDLNEREISNMPVAKFKIMIIKMLTGLQRRMDEWPFNKEMEII